MTSLCLNFLSSIFECLDIASMDYSVLMDVISKRSIKL